MKKTILIVAVFSMAVHAKALHSLNKGDNPIVKVVKTGTRHIDLTLKSKEGCSFHIVGEAGAFPPSFTGSITCGGPNPPCPKGKFEVALVVPEGRDVLEYKDGSFEIFNIIKNDRDLELQVIKAIEY